MFFWASFIIQLIIVTKLVLLTLIVFFVCLFFPFPLSLVYTTHVSLSDQLTVLPNFFGTVEIAVSCFTFQALNVTNETEEAGLQLSPFAKLISVDARQSQTESSCWFVD